MSRMLNLRVFKDGRFVEQRMLSQDVIKIGKLETSHLRLHDDAIARMHAVIEVSGSEVRVVDLGSPTGTKRNDTLVCKSDRVAHGDVLAFGPYRVEVEFPPATDTAVATRPAPMPTMIDTQQFDREGTQVAEVVAKYGSTVLDVRHVGAARSKPARALAAMAMGGLAILAGSAVFAYDATRDWSAYETARLDAVERGQPTPTTPDTGWGGLGLMLAFAGLVPMSFGVIARRDRGLPAYSIGESTAATFVAPVDGAGTQSCTELVRDTGSGFVLQVSPGMHAELEVPGEPSSLSDLTAPRLIALPIGSRARVHTGGLTYHVGTVSASRVLAGRAQTDKVFWAFNAASLCVIGGFIGLTMLMPEDALAMDTEEVAGENRFVGYMTQPDDAPEPEPELVEPEENPEVEPAGDAGARHSGPEGRMGDPKERSSEGLYAIKGPKSAIPQLSRNFANEIDPSRAGILGMIAQDSAHFLASPHGGEFAIGNDDADIWGSLHGNAIGPAFGNAGLGLVGTGRQGGGEADGLVGTGAFGLMGKNGKDGGGDRYGRPSGTAFREKTKKQPDVRVAKADVKGAYDKDLIRRVVRAHLNEVRHCYNEGLARDPSLTGRVTVQFSIGPSGKVGASAVVGKTIDDDRVPQCIAKATKRWSFPKPPTASSVLVSYPFVLTPA